MINYLVMRIKSGALDYEAVTERFPQFKEAIDELLYTTAEGGESS